MAKEKFYMVKEVAEILGLTKGRVYDLIYKGELQAVKSKSRTLFISESEIEKFKRTHKVVTAGKEKHYISLPNGGGE